MAVPMNHTGMTSERTRHRMVERLEQVGIQDQRVLNAMRRIPRHLFVDEAIATRAYDNIALPIGHNQTISQPYIVARMTELLAAGRTLHNVLEIGTGCGYQTAVLLAMKIDKVHSIERLAPVLELARRNLRVAKFVHARLVHGDGSLGLIEAAPFDGIIVTAAAEKVPMVLVEQLQEGGRLVMPVGDETQQFLWTFEKTSQGVQQKRIEPVKFVPLLTGKA